MQIKYPENFVVVPLVQVVEKRPVSVQSTIVGEFQPKMIKTSSSGFYERPQSVGKPLKGSVMYVNGNSQLVIQNKPKISVISGKMVENQSPNQILNKVLRRSTIFNQQQRPFSQIVR